MITTIGPVDFSMSRSEISHLFKGINGRKIVGNYYLYLSVTFSSRIKLGVFNHSYKSSFKLRSIMLQGCFSPKNPMRVCVSVLSNCLERVGKKEFCLQARLDQPLEYSLTLPLLPSRHYVPGVIDLFSRESTSFVYKIHAIPGE